MCGSLSVDARKVGKSTTVLAEVTESVNPIKTRCVILERERAYALAFREKSAIIQCVGIVKTSQPERWQSGRMRSIANAVSGSNRTAGSNPALSARLIALES